jgi:hypothetical protein
MQVQGIVIGNYIKLLRETDFPDGQPVTVNIRPDSFSLEEKRRLLDELCGSWTDDSSIDPIFKEIEQHRRDSTPRKVNFDASS